MEGRKSTPMAQSSVCRICAELTRLGVPGQMIEGLEVDNRPNLELNIKGCNR